MLSSSFFAQISSFDSATTDPPPLPPASKPTQRRSRSPRSHTNLNQPTGKELLYLSQLMANHTPLNSYREHTDTNPELCRTVAGLSNGQRKLCVQHTHVMPAISRGARSALQVSTARE